MSTSREDRTLLLDVWGAFSMILKISPLFMNIIGTHSELTKDYGVFINYSLNKAYTERIKVVALWSGSLKINFFSKKIKQRPWHVGNNICCQLNLWMCSCTPKLGIYFKLTSQIYVVQWKYSSRRNHVYTMPKWKKEEAWMFVCFMAHKLIENFSVLASELEEGRDCICRCLLKECRGSIWHSMKYI